METTQLGADHAMTTGSTASAAGMHGPAHMPSMALVPLDQVTHTAVQSGDWSDPATWGGAVPGEGAKVHVPAGLRVTVDTTLAPEIKTLRVDGTLDFATDRTTELRVDTLVTTTSGTLEIGTAAAPIAEGVTATIVFADDGAIDQNWDPTLVSRGAILHGTTTIYGAQKAAFTTLETQPLAGATEITLDAPPSGWRVGDTIAIAGTDPKDPTTDETRVITEIVGNTVRFAVPLERDHVAPRPDLDVHVANLTRNVVFTSENTAIDHRGHVMVMHTNDADVNFAAFDDLGRSDKTVPYDDWVLPELNPVEPELLGGDNVRGRYSFHVHRGGTDKDDNPAKVNGSVVTDGPGWGFVNHSSNVNFTNNVTHNVVGAAYYTEAGDEIGSFIGNIAMRTVNPDFPLETGETVETSITDNGIPRRDSFLGEEGVGDPTDPGGRELRQDYGFQGDGFWFHGPNVQVENNVVTGASGHAYIWWAEGLIERFPDGSVRQMTHDAATVPGGDLIGPDGTQVQIYDTPISSFDGNQGYSATNGLRFFYFQTDFFGPGVYEEAGVTPPPPAYDAQLRSTIAKTTIWNVERTGLDASYANNITLKDSTFIGTGDPSTVGIDLDHPFTERGWQISNVTVEDFGTGIQAPRQGGLLIDGATLANLTDVEIRETQGGARDLTFRDVVLAPLDNALAGQEAGRTNYDLTVTTGVEAEVRRTEWDPLWFLQPDRIVVESTDGARQALFFPEQRPDFVPVPATDPLAAVLPTEIVGLTNQQLMDQYGLSFAGGLLPSGATPGAETQTGRFTDGLVGSPL
ncbi:MAG: G8 domain-containing protein, partial [Pseudomonadota bacterium]